MRVNVRYSFIALVVLLQEMSSILGTSYPKQDFRLRSAATDYWRQQHPGLMVEGSLTNCHPTSSSLQHAHAFSLSVNCYFERCLIEIVSRKMKLFRRACLTHQVLSLIMFHLKVPKYPFAVENLGDFDVG